MACCVGDLEKTKATGSTHLRYHCCDWSKRMELISCACAAQALDEAYVVMVVRCRTSGNKLPLQKVLFVVYYAGNKFKMAK